MTSFSSRLAVAIVLLPVLSACSLVSDDGAEQAAEELAKGLSAGSLDRVRLGSPADRDAYRQATRNITDVPLSVKVDDVTESDSTATVTLDWSWDLGARRWSYQTHAELSDRAGTWELVWDPEILAPRLSDGEVLDVDYLAGTRGRILGADDRPLVTKRPVRRYGLDKTAATPRQWRSSADRIARAVGVDPRTFRAKVASYGPQAFVEAVVLRSEEAATTIPADYGSIPGASVQDDEIPLGPTKEFAAPLVGTVGPATAEILEEADGALQPGAEVGLSGLQARYDETLRGSDGVQVEAVSSSGSRTLFRAGVRNGRDLRTTLDLNMQLKAEQVLAAHLEPKGPSSALVAIRPSTGEILAAANGPANDGFNAATAGRYAPGSTFKIVTALALMRSGLSPDDTVECGATTSVDGRSFKNYDDYPAGGLGSITFTQAIANSCNTALINSRGRLDRETLGSAAASLGLGVDHGLGFPAYFGQAPPAVGETEKAADLIGQGKILASPLAMAAVAASAASGKTVLPVLLPAHKVAQKSPEERITPEEAAELRAMMRAVVTRGSATFLADLPGEVAAKTGTAEYGRPDEAGALPTHTWMIATRGDLAVAVFVETGESGSQTAGPILEDFLR